MSSDEPLRRIVQCLDAHGRNRVLTVLADKGVVTLHTPPGETAQLHPQTIGTLRQDLADAQARALQQRGGEF